MTALGDPDPDFRRSHVGAAEVACLFGANPWLTEYELWHRKAGNIDEPEFGTEERQQWGLRLEPVIYEAAAERYGYQLREPVAHLSNGLGLGGHPDRRVTDPDRGPGIVEIKTTDAQQFGKWGDEPPLNYLLQAQTYAGLDRCNWVDIVVLIGGNRLERFAYDFRLSIYREIERRVAAFWESIAAGDPPVPNPSHDGATLLRILGEPTDEVADLSGDNYADELARQYISAKATAAEFVDRAERAKVELLIKIGAAGRAVLPNHRIGCGQTKDVAGTLITPELVGTHVGARKGYRRFDVREAG